MREYPITKEMVNEILLATKNDGPLQNGSKEITEAVVTAEQFPNFAAAITQRIKHGLDESRNDNERVMDIASAILGAIEIGVLIGMHAANKAEEVVGAGTSK